MDNTKSVIFHEMKYKECNKACLLASAPLTFISFNFL